jgi:hypothetical protein
VNIVVVAANGILSFFGQGVKVAVKELDVQKLHVNREVLLEIKQVRVCMQRE